MIFVGEYVLLSVICTGGGKGEEDSDDDEPAAKKKATPALVSLFSYFLVSSYI